MPLSLKPFASNLAGRSKSSDAPMRARGLVLPHRWVVERTFGWLGRYCRLACDFEHTVSSSEAMTYIASIRRMLKLVAK